jgi:hypothetical protein
MTQIRPGWVLGMLVREHPLQYQDFLTTTVLMRRKRRPWLVTYDRRGTRDFITHTIKHLALHAKGR